MPEERVNTLSEFVEEVCESDNSLIQNNTDNRQETDLQILLAFNQLVMDKTDFSKTITY